MELFPVAFNTYLIASQRLFIYKDLQSPIKAFTLALAQSKRGLVKIKQMRC